MSLVVEAAEVPRASVARSKFYVGLSATIVLIVLVGFAPTLYFRRFFDVPEITPLLLLHGIVMTAWYVAALLQASLIARHARQLHMKLGWVLVGLAIVMVFTSLAVDATFAERRLQLGAPVAAIVGITWSDRAALLCFALFFTGAVLLRARRDVHKRLMLLASISMLQPATSRIWRWPVFDDVQIPPGSLGLGVLTLLVVAVAVHDFMTTRRIHPATLAGGALLVGSKLLFTRVIASTAFGIQSVVG